MMTIRTYSPEDYPMVSAWWNGHDWPAVPEAILPKLGIIVEDADGPVAAGWLYMDNSVGVSMLEWIVTRPDCTPRQAMKSVSMLAEFMKEEAKRLDYGVTLTTTRLPALARLLERGGFTRSDDQMIHLIRTN